MGLGRRKIRIDDEAAWVFNRMADVYDARPPYPSALVDALSTLASASGPRIVDIGAGTGHVALPLAARGFQVVAVEPSRAMLERLRATAKARDLTFRTEHAPAEALPLGDASIDLAIIADALHFLDRERTALELKRVLRAGGALAVVTCELSDTPFMCGLVELMREAAPRRPRELTDTTAQLSALCDTPLDHMQQFHDHTPVDPETLERILRSISFIGPAMNAERFAAFRTRVHALPGEPVWARTFTLRSGHKRS